MGLILPALLLVAAVLIAPPRPRLRLRNLSNRPRDGPTRTRSHPASDLEVADDIDLYAVALSAGLPPVAAAGILARCGAEALRAHWATVEKLLVVGVRPQRAWEPLAEIPALRELADLAGGSQHTGSRIREGAGRISAKLREANSDKATANAEKAGVFIALPLTVCFLPAFFILGLAPVVLGLIDRVF